jgi:cytoplasmic iron level regulating protein YaaA (DUF328/UPF0246 family)
MIVILSPAKTLNFKSDSPTVKYSLPRFAQLAGKIIDKISNYHPEGLIELM